MRVLELAYVIALGSGLGLASAHYAVSARPWIGKVEIGPWTGWPKSGARDADPYMRAYLARGVHLPLGAGEGLELIATRDDDGRALETGCRYAISGLTPPARGWSIGLTDAQGKALLPPDMRGGFTDAEIVREEHGRLRILVSASPEPGNWLPLPGPGGRFQLRLRLYDTPISSHAGELQPQALPRVTQIACP